MAAVHYVPHCYHSDLLPVHQFAGKRKRKLRQFPDLRENEPGRMFPVMENCLDGFLRMRCSSEWFTGIGIAVITGKITAGNLNTDPVSGKERHCRSLAVDIKFCNIIGG